MSATETTETDDRVRRFVRDIVSRDGVPGLAVAISTQNETVFAEGVGARDRATNVPATPETLFGIGSTTKSVTALTVLSLVDDGILSLDDSVGDFLPVAFDGTVTIHHLLSHTSGAPSNGMANVLLSRLTGVNDLGVPLSDRAEFLAHVNEAIEATSFEPGSRFHYYASGFTLLGLLIEEVTGQSYQDVVAERILTPVGMTRSTFSQTAFRDEPDRMTPYAPTAAGFEPAPFPFHELIDATGGLLAPVDELAAYVRLFLNEGDHDGTQVVSPHAIETMCTAHADTKGEMGVDGYGYALMVDELDGEPLVGHSGDAIVSSGYVGFLPETGYGVAIGCNTSPPFKLNLLGKAILAIVRGGSPADAVPYFERREHFSSLTGTYEAHRGTKRVRVVSEGARLSLEIEGMIGSTRVPLVPRSLAAERTTFDALQTSATPMTVEFAERDGRMDLRMERWHLRRTAAP